MSAPDPKAAGTRAADPKAAGTKPADPKAAGTKPADASHEVHRAMRPMWAGAITFGLITIPVRLYRAVEEKSMRFHHLHGPDKGRVRYQRVCSVCSREVPFGEVVKGYEYEKDRHVVFSEKELEHLPVESIKAIDVVSFVSLDEIDPIYFQRSYYVVPEPTGLKAYRLLAETLGRSGRVGIAKVVLLEKEHLAVLRTRGRTFVLETMHWPDEIRTPAFDVLARPVELRKQELALAGSLVELLSDRFDAAQFVDSYRQRLQELAWAKIQGEEIVVVLAAQPPQVTDLLEALQASVEAEKRKRRKAPKRPKGKDQDQ
jgi:DNA end-binding protein Ku